MKGRKFNINSRKSFQRSLKHFAGKANAVNIIGVYGKSDTTSLAALPLNCRFKTCESDIQLAIFEIQTKVTAFSQGRFWNNVINSHV